MPFAHVGWANCSVASEYFRAHKKTNKKENLDRMTFRSAFSEMEKVDFARKGKRHAHRREKLLMKN